VAVGEDDSSAAALWTSSDGIIWSQVPYDILFGDAGLSEVIAGGRGLISVGASGELTGDMDAVVWIWEGIIWSEVPYDVLIGDATMSEVIAGGRGLISVGASG
jgi:hypothetical protein